MTGSRSRLVALLLCGANLFACKSDGKQPDPTQSAPTVSARSAGAATPEIRIRFTARNTVGEPFSESRFRTLAARAVRKAVPPQVTLVRAVLTGELIEAPDESTLRLSVRLEAKGVSSPLRTGLLAGARGRVGKDLVTDGLRDLSAAMGEILHLVRAPEEGIISALSAAEPDVQIAAAAVAADRRLTGTRSALCAALRDPREEIADAAAEALRAIGRPDTVSCIIGSVQKGVLRSQVRVIETIARIGGDEATAYLEMTAEGHPVPEVRELSRTLLADLRARSHRPAGR